MLNLAVGAMAFVAFIVSYRTLWQYHSMQRTAIHSVAGEVRAAEPIQRNKQTTLTIKFGLLWALNYLYHYIIAKVFTVSVFVKCAKCHGDAP